MPATESTQARYDAAVRAFVERVRQDPYILAVVLVGSLSHDVVWEKSDIDLVLVTQEGKLNETSFSLLEDGIHVHAYLTPRSAFRKSMEGSLQSSFMHSLLNHGRLVFTRDETLPALFEGRQHVGAHDREVQLLRAACWVIPSLTKAEKWLRVRQDPDYSFYWIMKSLDSLATIETIWNGEVTGREVVQQALRHNPGFFGAVYTGLIRGEKTMAALEAALGRIQGYLLERAAVLFRPILEYLEESAGPRSSTEMTHHFRNQLNLEGVDLACEWLAEQEILGKTTLPAYLTPKSRVAVEEAAYLYGAVSS